MFQMLANLDRAFKLLAGYFMLRRCLSE
jgi:hypothetical protein